MANVAGFLLLIITTLLAHNPNEAFFTVSMASGNTIILAELPWSVRNDLIRTYPELEHSKANKDYEAAFYKYIQEKLILRSSSGLPLTLLAVAEEQHNGHSHQNNFRMVYQGNNYFQIENSILFASYDNQKNYHFINKDGQQNKFVTSLEQPSFTIDGRPLSSSNHLKYWLIVSLVILPLVGFFLIKRKRTV